MALGSLDIASGHATVPRRGRNEALRVLAGDGRRRQRDKKRIAVRQHCINLHMAMLYDLDRERTTTTEAKARKYGDEKPDPNDKAMMAQRAARSRITSVRSIARHALHHRRSQRQHHPSSLPCMLNINDDTPNQQSINQQNNNERPQTALLVSKLHLTSDELPISTETWNRLDERARQAVTRRLRELAREELEVARRQQ